MLKNITIIYFITVLYICDCCLITNCPRGGKRSRYHHENNIKPCISCGPGHTGQCFGPNICCGPFGCLFGTAETARCQKDGLFQETEPCIAGSGYCRRNTGRCASDGICCTQESCFVDKTCSVEEKLRMQDVQFDSLYNILEFGNEISTM